jgi:hypothetical protein
MLEASFIYVFLYALEMSGQFLYGESCQRSIKRLSHPRIDSCSYSYYLYLLFSRYATYKLYQDLPYIQGNNQVFGLTVILNSSIKYTIPNH